VPNSKNNDSNLISVHNKSHFLQKISAEHFDHKNIDFPEFSHKKFIFAKYNQDANPKIDIFEFIDKNIDSTFASV